MAPAAPISTGTGTIRQRFADRVKARMSEFKLLTFIFVVAVACVLGGIGVDFLLRGLMVK